MAQGGGKSDARMAKFQRPCWFQNEKMTIFAHYLLDNCSKGPSKIKLTALIALTPQRELKRPIQ